MWLIPSPREQAGQKGDLYLVIQVAEDPRFEVKGNDLHTEVTIDLYTAVLGGEVTVQTLSGNVVLTIPAGIQPGQSIRLAGRGIPRLNSPEQQGRFICSYQGENSSRSDSTTKRVISRT